MKVAIICDGNCGSATFNALVTVAHKVGTHIDALMIGPEETIHPISLIQNVKRVVHFQGSFLAESLAPAIVEEVRANTYGYLLAPANTFGKNILPRVAALLDVIQISDVTHIVGPDTFERPIYAGNAIETVRVHDPIKALTIRVSCFSNKNLPEQPPCPIEKQELQAPSYAPKIVTFQETTSQRPDILQAQAIVSGGRGLQKKEDFHLLEALADHFSAAIGATRAVVDAGFISNDHQIGQTGKIVAPDLYFAIGISGAIQHLSGMKESRVIVAINKDSDAPIFQVADYGLVADLYQVIPELIAILKEGKHEK